MGRKREGHLFVTPPAKATLDSIPIAIVQQQVASQLIERLDAGALLADHGYDTDSIVSQASAAGIYAWSRCF